HRGFAGSVGLAESWTGQEPGGETGLLGDFPQGASAGFSSGSTPRGSAKTDGTVGRCSVPG
ncbi:MAG: hypothetical protein ACRDRU_22080, partial [Pseudonocardiaceae bacterium]